MSKQFQAVQADSQNKEDLQIPQFVLPTRRFSHSKNKSSPFKKWIISIIVIVSIALIAIGFIKLIDHFQNELKDLLLKEDTALVKLQQAVITNQNLKNQLEKMQNNIQNIPKTSSIQQVPQLTAPINPNPDLTLQIAQLQQKNSELQQRLTQLQQNSAQIQQALAQKQRIILDINEQINIKRKNQNSFRTLMCKKYIQFEESQHSYDPNLMTLLTGYYAQKSPQSIADFGCGRCQFIISLSKKGYDAWGYDGTPYANESHIKQMDLSQKTDLGRKFDYVQSFQVGQHIYSDLQDNFIYNIVTHATKGIILSWSIVGQGGYMHVNNRNNDYIIQKVEKYNFRYNPTDTIRFRNGLTSITNNLRATVMVFTSINV